ncbi:kinase-like domain-containing protein [Cercophora samala]|uniref:Kinase-like domain-containing protein n=1 Tax=Cercophora samala TaxID=330535 RepID=A0AA40D8Z9_9PEZI|nr:kinase-like domain-containing protein [Cercophora samala]
MADFNATDRIWVSQIGYLNGILIDWSRQGYTTGRHVDFRSNGLPPGIECHEKLSVSTIDNKEKGNSSVDRVNILGISLAMKTYKYGTKEYRDEVLAEISILRRLRHHHIIEYVGSMTHPNTVFSALFWPVAPCALDDFFRAIDVLAVAVSEGNLSGFDMIDSIRGPSQQKAASLLREIVAPVNLRVNDILQGAIQRVLGSFGCLAEALSYIHGQRVSHKDIKPSNILIYRNEAIYQQSERNPNGETVKYGIRLTDFDGAIDHFQAQTSIVTHERYTRAYVAPETLQDGRSRRSADIFSMGCVFLEMLALTSMQPHLTVRTGANQAKYFSQQELKREIKRGVFAFHAHDGTLAVLVDKVSKSFATRSSRVRQEIDWLKSIVLSMLGAEPDTRPTADMVVLKLSAVDVLRTDNLDSEDQTLSRYSLFGGCCSRFALDPTESRYLLPGGKAEDYGGAQLTPRIFLERPSPPSLSSDDTADDYEDALTPATNRSLSPATVRPIVRNLIPRNKDRQRIDPPGITFEKWSVKGMKELCQFHYLHPGGCRTVDCKFYHQRRLSDRELDVFRAWKRHFRCVYGGECNNPNCFSGHHCPHMVLNKWTNTATCRQGGPKENGGMCSFPPEMHDIDLNPVS